jgi:type II secretion system protein G
MNKQKGFTLIELLVVVAIIGILSSVVLTSLNSARSRARDAKRISDLRSIQTALQLYYTTNGSYPPSFCSSANANGTPPSNSPLACWSTFLSGYIPSLPLDPINQTSSFYFYSYLPNVAPNTGACTTQLVSNSGPGKYVITARLENSYNSPNYCAGNVSNGLDNGAANYVVSSPS